MIYTLDQFKQTVQPMIATALSDPRDKTLVATQLTDALARMFSEDREALIKKAPSDTSDGFHTFDELYRFRMLYNAALFNAWAEQRKHQVYKSHLHSDGEKPFGGGWFIVGAQLPTGQISNHYEDQYWDLFVVPEVARGAVWDGHTAQMVADRLEEFLRGRHVKAE